MSLQALFRYQFFEQLRRIRWFTPLPVGMLLGYWAAHVIQALQITSGLNSPGNGFEAFLWAFGKPEIVYFVATCLYIYLIGGLTPEKQIEQQIILRLPSRQVWWMSKVIWLLFSTVIYALLLFGAFFLVVALSLPFSSDWSAVGEVNAGIPLGYILKNGNPLDGVVNISAFLLVGWFAMGLLVMTANQITHNKWIGFLMGAGIILVAYSGSIIGGPIGGSGWESFFLIQNHLEYTPVWSPARVIPVEVSWVFWGVWIALCLLIGFVSIRKHDIHADGE